MALKIRMARGGAKKRPSYRIVVTDSRNARDGKFIEKLGTHNPFLDHANPQRMVVDLERVKYWLSVGAKSSDRLNAYFAQVGVEKAYTKFPQTKKNQPKQKAQERLKAEAERQQAAIDAEKAAQEAAIAAAAAPIVEPETVIEETPETVEPEVVVASNVETPVEEAVVEEAPAIEPEAPIAEGAEDSAPAADNADEAPAAEPQEEPSAE